MTKWDFCFYVNALILVLEAWIGYLVVEYEISGGFWFMAFLLLFIQSPDCSKDDDSKDENTKQSDNS